MIKGVIYDDNSSIDSSQQASLLLKFFMDNSSVDKIEYLDFELEINPGIGREYSISLDSPAGEAREMLRVPYDDLTLESRLESLKFAPDENIVKEIGSRLFNCLFTGEIRGLYDTSNVITRQKGCGLRIKLRINSPELVILPWEFLYDSRIGEYLSLSRYTPLIRYIELLRPIEPLAVKPPLHILGMICSPVNLPSLNVLIEKQRLEKALEELQNDGQVKLKWLAGETWRDLQSAMREGPWHIFHFIGHGRFNPKIDQGMIALTGKNGNCEWITATDFGGLLADHHSLRLVLLNSCEGAQGSKRDIFSSTASSLIRRGLPAVVAMQFEISNNAASEFSRSFYEAVLDKLPLEAVMSEARKAVRLALRNTYEWGTPVLYMRALRGIIFEITESLKPKKDISGEIVQEESGNERARQPEQLYQEGLNALRVDDWDKAISRFEGVLELQCDQAKVVIKRNDWHDTSEYLEMLVKESPGYKDTKELIQRARHIRDISISDKPRKMKCLIADYQDQRQALRNLCQPTCQKRILLLQGDSGYGKTHMLKACVEDLPCELQHIPVQLRKKSVGVGEIFTRAGLHIGWNRLKKFTKKVSEMSGQGVRIDQNWQMGINNQIMMALQAENMRDRQDRLTMLTDAWIEDLSNLKINTLVVMDTFEDSTPEVAEWIQEFFLARVAATPSIRVVIAGKQVPDANNIDWGACCTRYDLYGIKDVKSWLPIVREMRRKLPMEPGDAWLAGVCHQAHGNPAEIMKTIEALPNE